MEIPFDIRYSDPTSPTHEVVTTKTSHTLGTIGQNSSLASRHPVTSNNSYTMLSVTPTTSSASPIMFETYKLILLIGTAIILNNGALF